MIQDAGSVGGQHLMTRPLSNDLRERVVAAVAGGESCRSVASRFGVAVSSVVEVVAALSCDGLGGAGQDGRAPQAGAGAAPRLHHGADQADATPDAAPAERRTGGAWGPGLPQCGLAVPAAGWTASKNTLFAIEQARSDIARRRRRWRSWQAGLDPRCLVFIDET
jgi:transposase-like protein